MRFFPFLAFALAALATSAYAGLEPSREAIYTCKHLDHQSQVEGVMIYESRFGQGKIFHEVEVLEDFHGEKSSYFRKVNLISIYDGAIEHFTVGNFRVKIDRVRRDERGHMWAFARIPKHGIHSMDWVCKDY